MAYDDMNKFQKMERPEERKAEELRSKKDSRPGFKAKKSSKSVSLSTFERSGTIIALLVWTIFLAGVSYGTFLLVKLFMAG